jgi:hypothetical protein
VLADVLRNLRAKHTVKFLGSYPAAGDSARAKRKAAGRAWKEAQGWVEELRARVRRDEASGIA